MSRLRNGIKLDETPKRPDNGLEAMPKMEGHMDISDLEREIIKKIRKSEEARKIVEAFLSGSTEMQEGTTETELSR